MLKERLIKIIGLNLGIAVTDTVLFSPGLIGIELGGGSIFSTALGATAIFMSVVIFVYGNYKLFIEKDKIQLNAIKTEEDYIIALRQNYRKRTFEKDIIAVLEHIESFEKKHETIRGILLQKFNSTEMSFSKFDRAILDLKDVFYINIKSIVNKLNAFDEEDYNRIRKDDAKKKLSQEVIQKKMSIYEEYICFVKNASDDNEQIILKLDQLLLELSDFNSIEDGELEEMNEIKEIDDLINKTKLYK